LPLIIYADGYAFSNRQALKQVRILNRERDRSLKISFNLSAPLGQIEFRKAFQ
jgi:hypothetical protein